MIVTVKDVRILIREALDDALLERSRDPLGSHREDEEEKLQLADRLALRHGPVEVIRAIAEEMGSYDPDAFAEKALRRRSDPDEALERVALGVHINKLRGAAKALGSVSA